MPNPESGSSVTTIYNETYEAKRADEERKAQKLPGEIYRRNETILTASPAHGVLRISKLPSDQLEQDLAEMYGGSERGEFVLGTERHKQLYQEACLDVVRYCRKYIFEAKFQKLFPGLDVFHPGKYDFSAGKVKLFVLKNGDFQDFLSLVDGDAGSQSGGITTGRLYPSSWEVTAPAKILGWSIDNLYTSVEGGSSRNNLIVVQELHGPKFNGNTQPKTNEGVVECEDRLRGVMRHELTHALMYPAWYFPEQIEEGITEYFARVSRSAGEKFRTGDVYAWEARLVLAAVEMCRRAGMDVHSVKLALLSQYDERIDQFRKLIETKMGKDFTVKFFEKGFEDITDINKAINRLDSVPR